MPRKNFAPGTPEEWLVRAKSSLAIARQPKPEEVLWEDHCFLVHQAVEKVIKGVYQSRGLLFKFTHDIGELGDDLEKSGLRVPPEVREAFKLNKYAFEGRYPGSLEPVTEAEFRQALALATAVVKWAEKMIRSSEGFQPPSAHEKPAVYKVAAKKKKRKKKSTRQ